MTAADLLALDDNDDDDDNDAATIGSPILRTLGLTFDLLLPLGPYDGALPPPPGGTPRMRIAAASSSSHSLMHHDSAQDIHDRDTRLRNPRCILSSMARNDAERANDDE